MKGPRDFAFADIAGGILNEFEDFLAAGKRGWGFGWFRHKGWAQRDLAAGRCLLA